jgi:hypothetical protein
MNLKNIIGDIAPTVATALGGPFAGLAVSKLCNALGLPVSSREQDIAEYLTSNPDKLVEVKKAEIALSQRAMELEIEEKRIHAEDRNSARNREIQIRSKFNPILATIVILGFFATIGYIMSGYISLTGEQGILVGTIVGYASAKADQVISYYFGSSQGSEQKNNIIAALQR